MKKVLLITLFAATAFAYNVANFKEELNQSLANIKQILQSQAGDKSELIYKELKPNLDKELMPRLVLGKEYYKQAPAEFSELFFKYLRKDLASKIDLLDAKVMELKSASVQEKRCEAKAVVSYEDVKKELNFSFRRTNDQCLLYDMQLLDTSFIASYRAQFIDIIKQNGMNALISKLSK